MRYFGFIAFFVFQWFWCRSLHLIKKMNVLQCEVNWKLTTLFCFWWEIGSDANDGNMTSLQILKDEATREQYDYAIAHPEEVFILL